MMVITDSKKGRWVCDWASNKSAKCYITLQECLCSKLGNKRGSREISPQCLNSHITFFLSLSVIQSSFLTLSECSSFSLSVIQSSFLTLSECSSLYIPLSLCHTVFFSYFLGVFFFLYLFLFHAVFLCTCLGERLSLSLSLSIFSH